MEKYSKLFFPLVMDNSFFLNVCSIYYIICNIVIMCNIYYIIIFPKESGNNQRQQVPGDQYHLKRICCIY